MGARKFWRQYLPTLQFYNPGLKIDVVRIDNKDTKRAGVPCILEIVSKEDKVLDQIDMKNKKDDTIMNDLLQRLDFEPIPEESLIKV